MRPPLTTCEGRSRRQVNKRVPACAFFLCFLHLSVSVAHEEEQEATKLPAALIHAGTLLDVPGTAPKHKQTVVVQGDKIVSVQAGYVSAQQLDLDASEINEIDLKDKFVLPGLIDSHVHITHRYGDKPGNTALSGEERLLAGVVNARATLEAGVTTVADLDAGFDSWPVIVLRDAIRAGEIAGPTILAAGSSISPTGGHGDLLDRPDQVLELFASPGLCDGVGECRRAVRRQFRQGADLIKIHATGGGNERTGGKHHAPSFMMDELTTIVETAHSLDLKATAHAHATAGINAALRAGVDSIEHGSFLDDESIRLFKRAGAYLVPTLDVQDMIAERMNSVPERRRERMKLFQEEHPARFLLAYQAGVKIAMGSDAGVVPHGSNAREVEWLVKAGVSAAAALRIATLGSADHLGLAGVTGKLAAGMEADVIAVAGNPLEDITALYEVAFVMKDGAVFKSTD